MTQASVAVDRELLGKTGKGSLILLEVVDGDIGQMVEKMADKVCRLRILEDEDGKTNLPLEDVEEGLLVVGQFTLYVDCREGSRPSFIKAGAPQMAESLYRHFMERCRTHVDVVEKGRFGVDMKAELLNDGPFALIFGSQELFGE